MNKKLWPCYWTNPGVPNSFAGGYHQIGAAAGFLQPPAWPRENFEGERQESQGGKQPGHFWLTLRAFDFTHLSHSPGLTTEGATA
jgi:hypothetical protein